MVVGVAFGHHRPGSTGQDRAGELPANGIPHGLLLTRGDPRPGDVAEHDLAAALVTGQRAVVVQIVQQPGIGVFDATG